MWKLKLVWLKVDGSVPSESEVKLFARSFKSVMIDFEQRRENLHRTALRFLKREKILSCFAHVAGQLLALDERPAIRNIYTEGCIGVAIREAAQYLETEVKCSAKGFNVEKNWRGMALQASPSPAFGYESYDLDQWHKLLDQLCRQFVRTTDWICREATEAMFRRRLPPIPLGRDYFYWNQAIDLPREEARRILTATCGYQFDR